MLTKDSRFMDLSELKRMSIGELIELADDFGIGGAGNMRRQELTFAILDAQSRRRGEITAEGVIEVLQDGFGFLRAPDHNYLPGADDVYVSPSQIRRFNLRTGDTVAGQIRPPKESERYFALLKIHEINGESSEQQRNKMLLFDNLTPLYPDERFDLETEPEQLSTRIIDLLCPLGKGQRCLLVAPPRSGKTVLLRDIAHALEDNHPDAVLIVLLIDERPEEVTEMRRAVTGEVISSTFDESPSRHVQVAEIVLQKAKRLAENRKDVVILLDSITRLARAYNTVLPASGKLLAGGLDAAALLEPKRFFGAARNLEEGGSITIVATALVDSGSAIDEAIYEEFKGTGNAELHLDRRLMEQRMFPCLDINKSGTRKDELLLTSAEVQLGRALRETLYPLSAADAIALLRAKLSESESNAELLDSLAE
jgi:transcription termination factor Rho